MFHKCFIISVTDNVCSWDNILYFLDQKAFLKPIWLYKLFCMYKSIFEFSYSDMISNFEFMIFVIMPNIIFNIRYTIPMTIFYHQFHKKINILFSEPVPLTCDRTYSKLQSYIENRGDKQLVCAKVCFVIYVNYFTQLIKIYCRTMMPIHFDIRHTVDKLMRVQYLIDTTIERLLFRNCHTLYTQIVASFSHCQSRLLEFYFLYSSCTLHNVVSSFCSLCLQPQVLDFVSHSI